MAGRNSRVVSVFSTVSEEAFLPAAVRHSERRICRLDASAVSAVGAQTSAERLKPLRSIRPGNGE